MDNHSGFLLGEIKESLEEKPHYTIKSFFFMLLLSFLNDGIYPVMIVVLWCDIVGTEQKDGITGFYSIL